MADLIVTDVDGVLLDWENHFHNYMLSQGHRRAYDAEPSYWQEQHYPDLSKIEARKMVYHYNTSAWMLGIPSFRDARSGVARLYEEGYKFVAITAMGTDPFSRDARMINLEREFGYGVFEDVICTDMYDPDSKRDALAKYGGYGRYWIEDKPANAVLGTEYGYKSVLMSHLHNEEFDESEHGIKRVSGWSDICDLILGNS